MNASHTIHINAPPETVWALTVNIDGWADWNPNVAAAERLDAGPFRVGSQARMIQPGLPPAVWTVTHLENGTCFVWETRVRGLHLIAGHRIAPSGSGTENVLSLDAKGVLAFVLSPLIARSSARTLERENQGLKRALEC